MIQKNTLLIVDDVNENLDILLLLLSDYDVIPALSGEEALSILNEEKIDLVLLDIMMPEMDGFEVCKQMKRNPQTTHIPVIFLTGKNSDEEIQKGFELGGVDYILKPFNPKELLSRVKTHLKLRSYEKNLEKRVQEELEKNKLKQQLIFQQSKQAALGELLIHIAHQWKQPLSSLASINLLYQGKITQNKEIDMHELLVSFQKSEELIMFMSGTINTFKNFYKPLQKEELFFLSQCVKNVLSILEATLHFNDIKLIINSHEEKMIYANINEISQVIFTILNNAKDIILQRKTPSPLIQINITNAMISIHDNAGGIEDSLIEEIFKPYVSTTDGFGIGLYLAQTIVNKNNAIIRAKNSDDGAEFIVEFIEWMD